MLAVFPFLGVPLAHARTGCLQQQTGGLATGLLAFLTGSPAQRSQLPRVSVVADHLFAERDGNRFPGGLYRKDLGPAGCRSQWVYHRHANWVGLVEFIFWLFG